MWRGGWEERKKAGVGWRETGKGRLEKVSIDKLDSSFTALCYTSKKEERNGEVEHTEEQYEIKGGFLFSFFFKMGDITACCH